MPPRTRRASSAGPSRFCLLEELPNELMIEAAHFLVVVDLPSAMRLCSTCKALRDKLEGVRTLAEARRLRWEPDLADGHGIEDEGCTLTGLTNALYNDFAAGSLLPTTGST